MGKFFLVQADQVTDVTGSETEAEEAGQGLLGDLPVNLRVIMLVAAAAILYFITRELYAVLINKEWHPANAKLLTFSIFFTLLCAVFTVLFVGEVLSFVIIAVWTVLVIFIVLAIFKRRK